MATDPNKKTLRHFQCRDYLWETFEQMSAELECSVDYLINEAMRQYARSRSYGPRAAGPASVPPPERPSSPPMPTTRPAAPPARPAAGVAPSAPRAGGIPPMPLLPGVPAAPRIPSLSGASLPPARAPATPAVPIARPAAPAGVRPPAMPPLPSAGAVRMPPMPAAGGPPPMPAARPAPPPLPAHEPAAHEPVLCAFYEGEQFPVTKEEFVIGRGQKTSDLVIRDSNVSRRHAVVIQHAGQYWMVDQQSTNGVEFMGAKIDRKRIEDGDVFKICDHEIQFAYS